MYANFRSQKEETEPIRVNQMIQKKPPNTKNYLTKCELTVFDTFL